MKFVTLSKYPDDRLEEVIEGAEAEKDERVVFGFYKGDAEIQTPAKLLYQHETESIVQLLERLGYKILRIRELPGELSKVFVETQKG